MNNVNLKDIGYLLNNKLPFGSYYELFPQLLFVRKPAIRPEDLESGRPIYTQTFSSEELTGRPDTEQDDEDTNLVTRVPRFYLNTVIQAVVEPPQVPSVPQSEKETPKTVLLLQTDKEKLETQAAQALSEAEKLKAEVERLQNENQVLLLQRDPLYEEREKAEKEKARILREQQEQERLERERVQKELERIEKERLEKEARDLQEKLEREAREQREREENERRVKLDRYNRELDAERLRHFRHYRLDRIDDQALWRVYRWTMSDHKMEKEQQQVKQEILRRSKWTLRIQPVLAQLQVKRACDLRFCFQGPILSLAERLEHMKQYFRSSSSLSSTKSTQLPAFPVKPFSSEAIKSLKAFHS